MSTPPYNKAEKSVNLSPLEQNVYFNFYEKEVFRTDDVYRQISNKKTARQIISRLKKKGYIKQIRRGLFAVVPAQMIGKDYTVDRILIASQLATPYFLSHHTALEIHGVAQSYFNIVYISTNKILKSFDFQGTTYRFVTTKYLFGTEPVSRGNRNISASDRERTILDCIRNIEYAGNIEELAKSISAFSGLDYKKLLKYLDIFDEKSLYHRTGFIFDTLRDELNVPEDFVDKITKKLSRRTYYLLKKTGGTYNKKWNIMVPGNIKEMMKIA